MIGQGSPRASSKQLARAGRGITVRWRWWFALLVLAVSVPRGLLAETIRVRIAWGGGSDRLWQGTVSLDQGVLAEPQPLGIEADEPGSMWIQHGQLLIQQQSPRAYDGVDLLIDAPLAAKLLVQLRAGDDLARPIDVEVPLAAISGEFFDKVLDDQGNRILVRRTPGDQLRVRFARDLLVFSPGEPFDLTVEPHLLPIAAGSEVQIQAVLTAAGAQEWSTEHQIRAGQPVTIPLKVELPQQEGVYDLTIAATHNPGWQQAVRRPLNWKKTITLAERKVQLLVLDPQSPIGPEKTERELTPVVEIDPAKPGWREQLAKLSKLANIPGLFHSPLGSGNSHLSDKLTQLSPNREASDVSWEAYTLPIRNPGRPHVLEVEYPGNVAQTMGISVLEPNAAGALMPIGLDSGIHLAEEITGVDAAPSQLRHRLIFWPRTASPIVLMTNLRDRRPAVYGKIRVLAFGEHLPRAPAVPQPVPGRLPEPQRLLAAYFDRPLFPENFSAPESFDHWSRRSLDDWTTFHRAGTRLVEYLHYVGYNGLMISVLADGSTIYPSALVQPTPRYDTGIFFATAQDPVRKDVLEMLFRLCDREGLQLIPAIDFAAPLPALEAIRRSGKPGSEAIEWIGRDGTSRRRTHPTRRGLGPYYNVLHPRVQEAMLDVVRELIGRYAHHPSFAGMAIQLSGHGYAQLPGPEWGLDDVTVAHFQQDTNLQVPGVGPNRFAGRADFLAGQNRKLWLEWRAAQLSRFYRRAHADLTTIRPGSRLYLAGAGALDGPELEHNLRPTLPRRMTMAEALLETGIDVRHYRSRQGAEPEGIVLLRCDRITSTGSLGAEAVSLEINRMPDVDHYFRDAATPGSLFFHQPQEVRVGSFDVKSPIKATYTWLVTQPVPSGRQNRRRFVHSLATLDSQVMIDGGWMLPMGQEESLRNLVAAYRRLPAVQFQQVGDRRGAGSSQPVTFRYCTHGERTYVYVVNDAPFGTTARVRVDAPAGCRLEELTGLRRVAPLHLDGNGTYWTVDLQPFDLVAVRLSHPGVKLSWPQVSLPGAVPVALGQQIRELGARTASLRNPPPPLNVPDNAGFEQAPADGNPIPGWIAMNQAGTAVALHPVQPYGGKQSVRMSSAGPVTWLVSQPFEPPTTGRLWISVWLRVGDAAAQPPLTLGLEGRTNGPNPVYERFAPVGLNPGGKKPAKPIGNDWTWYVFPVDDLPLDGLSQLRVRFELKGQGEVWIDDVQLYDLVFTDNEKIELEKLVALADVTLQNGQVSDCMRLLEGYWPRLLKKNVPLLPAPIATRPSRPSPPAAERSKEGIMDRVKGLLRKPSWL